MASFYKQLQPIYPLLAQQFVDDYGLERGRCVDIGAGPGFVGIEIAKITEMEIYFVDLKQESLDEAQKNVEAAELENQVHFIKSDVHALSLEDDFAHFVVSRGSIWFWEDPPRGLQEVYRILKPMGTAIIGGGMGRYLPVTMKRRLKEANKKRLAQRGEKRPGQEEFASMVEKAALPYWRVIQEDKDAPGRWAEIKKTVPGLLSQVNPLSSLTGS